MLKEAEQYVEDFPTLEWLYFGRLQFDVFAVDKRTCKESRKYAVLYSIVRIAGKQKRSEMFENKNGW